MTKYNKVVGYTLSIGFLFDTFNEVFGFVVYAYISTQIFAGR